MMDLDIPGFGYLCLSHLVLDYNGTLAMDGQLIDGVKERLVRISRLMEIHVVTADTFGTVRGQFTGQAVDIHVLPCGKEAEAKRDFVEDLGSDRTACMGNGNNDHLMLKEACLGIGVILGEGAARSALMAADMIVTDILAGLDLFLHPARLKATLRT